MPVSEEKIAKSGTQGGTLASVCRVQGLGRPEKLRQGGTEMVAGIKWHEFCEPTQNPPVTHLVFESVSGDLFQWEISLLRV